MDCLFLFRIFRLDRDGNPVEPCPRPEVDNGPRAFRDQRQYLRGIKGMADPEVWQ